MTRTPAPPARVAPAPRRLLAAAAVIAAAVVGCESGDADPAGDRQTFEVDLAAVPENGPIVSLNGWDGPAKAVRAEGAAAVVRVPNGPRGNRVAVDVKFRLAGDFETEAAYRDLDLPEVTGGYGTGVGVQLNRDTGRYRMLFVGRVRMPMPGMSKTKEAWKVVRRQELPEGEEGPEHDHFFFPASGTAGAIRLVREGDAVRCLVSETAGGAFRELPAIEFGPEPVERVALGVDTGGPVEQPVTATLTRLAVTADSLPIAPTVAPPAGPDPTLIAFGVAAVAFGAAGFVLWRRRAA